MSPGGTARLGLADLFHVGLVVPEITAAVEEHAACFGAPFTPVEEIPLRMRGPHGSLRTSLRVAFTRDGPVRLELIEAVEGTIWDLPTTAVGAVSPAHHLGVWVADLPGESQRLAALGAALACTLDVVADRPTLFAYHRLPSGALVELVDARSRPAFERWFAGGPFPVVT